MKIRQLEQTNPLLMALRTAEQKFNELNHRRSVLNHEIEARCERLRALEARKESRDRLEMEATALLQGETIDTSVKDIEQLRHELEVVERALDLQKGEVGKARGAMSIALSELNKNEYVEIERKIATAVKALADANAEEIQFFRQLIDAGCHSIRFRPMRLSVVGTLDDNQSLASFHQREVREHCPQALQ